jgi:hypothetical protein
MIRKRFIAIILILCFAATALIGCRASEPEYDEDGALIIPTDVERTMERALRNIKSGGNSLNGLFANWHRDMIDSGLETGYIRYDQQRDLLETFRTTSRARNAYILYDYDEESDEYIISMYVSRDLPLPFNSRREATHAIREAFEGRRSVEMFAWESDNDDVLLSAFTPLYDENAEIIAVLGLDMPAPAVLDNPEWNRDSPRWNGLTE